METELTDMTKRVQPVVQETLAYLADKTISNYEARGEAVLPEDAYDRVERMLRDVYAESIPFAGQLLMADFKDCFQDLETKQTQQEIYQEIIDEYMQRYGARKVVQITETTREQIRRVISAGQREALSNQQIAQRLRQVIPTFTPFRSALIARTESHGSSNFAQLRTARQSSRPLVKIWSSSSDDRTRDFGEGDGEIDEFDHRVMNGVSVATEQKFMVPKRTGVPEGLDFPGDPDGSGANVINCRCSMSFRRADRPQPATQEKPPAKPAAPPKPKPAAEQTTTDPWAGLSQDEREHVAKAFANADPRTLRIIPLVGDLHGGVTFANEGSWHRSSDMRINMEPSLKGRAYDVVMRHEYGHHIDAQIERRLLARLGSNAYTISRSIGISRLARKQMQEDAELLFAQRSSKFFNSWTKTHVSPSEGFYEKVVLREAKIQKEFGPDITTDSALRAKMQEQLNKRGMSLEEVEDLFPDFYKKAYDLDERIDESIRFLASYDEGDHHFFLNRGSYGHESMLSGLSDSIGAATNQKIGYRFGHSVEYYEQFREYDKSVFKDPSFQELLSETAKPTTGIWAYGSGNNAQIWANWFEAYTSGSATQYTIFRRFFPNTSKRFEVIIEDYINGKLG